MIKGENNYKEYLGNYNKTRLGELVTDYHELCAIYGSEITKNIEKKKKNDIIEYLNSNLNNFLMFWIKTIDNTDYQKLKELLTSKKKSKKNLVNDNEEFINMLIEKGILFVKEDIEIPKDVYNILKELITNKEIISYRKKNSSLFDISNGLMVAYGVMDAKSYRKIISSFTDNALLKINYYYKKDYIVDTKKVVSNKLQNKKRITKYLKATDYKEFSNKDLQELGVCTYHHNMKSYKKLIKMLKNNYVFKNSDIMYLDRTVVIPYLYNSLNEEEIANKNLEETVLNLFEFKGDKLKNKIFKHLKEIRKEFPIWEYRGYSINEVK